MSGFGGVSIYQGSLGSGKSASAVAEAFKHLYRGGVVAANFSLLDGWCHEMAKRDLVGMLSRSYRAKLAHSLWSRFYKVTSLDAILSIDPKKEAVGKEASKPGQYMEGQGLLILDEAQLIFNSRKSMSGTKNLDWVEFFTQSRKLGWKVILIAHKSEMIDSQIRDLAEYEARMRNLQKVHVPLVGIPLSPIPLFLVITRYAGLGAGSGSVHSRALFPLPYWAARLYDSRLVFSREGFVNTDPAERCGDEPAPPPCGGAGRSLHCQPFFDEITSRWGRKGFLPSVSNPQGGASCRVEC